jgi:hypothetical protein
MTSVNAIGNATSIRHLRDTRDGRISLLPLDSILSVMLAHFVILAQAEIARLA